MRTGSTPARAGFSRCTVNSSGVDRSNFSSFGLAVERVLPGPHVLNQSTCRGPGSCSSAPLRRPRCLEWRRHTNRFAEEAQQRLELLACAEWRPVLETTRRHSEARPRCRWHTCATGFQTCSRRQRRTTVAAWSSHSLCSRTSHFAERCSAPAARANQRPLPCRRSAWCHCATLAHSLTRTRWSSQSLSSVGRRRCRAWLATRLAGHERRWALRETSRSRLRCERRQRLRCHLLGVLRSRGG